MRNDCNTDKPQKHPWYPIADVACGYDDRMTAAGCSGCHRQRQESALEQLQKLDARHSVDGIIK